MERKKLLSVCIITKDDEKSILNCLENIKELADEIIVVDMGSSDLTVDIAKKAGASVYRLEWDNDYSTAKNYCLDISQGRWVLFLEGFEWISKKDTSRIRNLLDNPNAEGYLFDIDNGTQNNRISIPTNRLRLFRNRNEYRYKYKSFEIIPEEVISNIVEGNILITRESDNNELDVKFEILKEELAGYPQDIYLQYIYGVELLNRNNYEEGIIYLKKACEGVTFDCLYAPHLYKCLCWALKYLERYNAALGILDEGIKAFPQYIDLLVLRGEIYKELKEYKKAFYDLNSSLEKKQQISFIPLSEINIATILEILGEAHEDTLNYEQAIYFYNEALKLRATNYNLVYKIGKIARLIDSQEKLENILKDAIDSKNVGQMVVIMDIYFQHGKYNQVLSNIKILESLLGENEELDFIKYCCNLMLNKLEDAKLNLLNINENSKYYSHVLQQRTIYYWTHSEWDKAEQTINIMEKLNNVEEHIKNLFKHLHKLFLQQDFQLYILKEEVYEVVKNLMENFISLKQVSKAQLLLPLILEVGNDQQLIEIGEIWAEVDDYEIIEKIFNKLSEKKNKLKFKEKIIYILLKKNYLDIAKLIGNLGNEPIAESIEWVIWSRQLINKFNKLFDNNTHMKYKVIERRKNEGTTTASKALIDFHNNLVKNSDKSYSITYSDIGSTEIHYKIGCLYIEYKKIREALNAFLKAIQLDPQNNFAQDKIKEIFIDNNNLFMNYLKDKTWISEGCYFNNKESFNAYVMGIMHFLNYQLEESISLFKKINEDENIYYISQKYIFISLLLLEKESEVQILLKDSNNMCIDFKLTLVYLKKYIIDKLEKALRKSPYSELIDQEIQRIQSVN